MMASFNAVWFHRFPSLGLPQLGGWVILCAARRSFEHTRVGITRILL